MSEKQSLVPGAYGGSPIFGTPVISTVKLNGKNFADWRDAAKLWFMCQGHLQHLPKDVSEIEESKKATWT